MQKASWEIRGGVFSASNFFPVCHSEMQTKFSSMIRRMNDVTKILSKIEAGDPEASNELLPLVYSELRKLAAARMATERSDHTLQATALVHEAYVRLVAPEIEQKWSSRGHFFAAAAEAMRRILVERARKKAGPNAGGDRQRVELADVDPSYIGSAIDVLQLDDALNRLASKYPRVAEVVNLRFFCGLKRREIAETLGVSVATIDDDWAYAKGWIRNALE